MNITLHWMNSVYKRQWGIKISLKRLSWIRVLLSSSIFLFLLVVNSGILPFISSGPPSITYASSHQQLDSIAYTDTVIVMDNVNQIRDHDPNGDRYAAAQLFVSLAPVGDRIGVVKITSSPAPAKILDLQNINNNADKDLIKSKLSQNYFGPVNENPTAYFTPALQTAGDILNKPPATNRKYVIIVTDAVALSGDQNSCPTSPDSYHNWFCAADTLEQEGISVILLGFTKPGSEAELQPTKQHIEAHGGTVLQIADGAGLSQRLAQAYTDLLTRIHPNMFSAKMVGTPKSVSVDAHDRLIGITFVALGNNNTSLSNLQTPGGQQVAGMNKNDGSFYSAVGTGYWLENINSGDLTGIWQLTASNPAPSEILVIGTSEGRFQLLNPAPAHGNSDVSLRFVAPLEPIVLRARVTSAGDVPLTDVSFVANPQSDNQKFSTEVLPTKTIAGSAESDVSALLNASTAQTDTLSIGLGQPLVKGVYLMKNYTLAAKDELAHKGIQVSAPQSTLLARGASIHITAQGTESETVQSLSIFGRDSSATVGWTLIGVNRTTGTNVAGEFTPTRGCGNTYILAAIEEITGSIKDGQYDYLAYDSIPYISKIQQGTTGQATLSSGTYLEWWPSQAKWNINFSTTACSPQNVELAVKLYGKSFTAPPVTLRSSSTAFTIPSNSGTDVPLNASLGGCPFSFFEDRTAVLQLVPNLGTGSANTFVKAGDWQATIVCPSAYTNITRYPLWAVPILLLLSVLFVRFIQLPILPFVPKTHLTGSVEVTTNAAVLTGSMQENFSTYIPITAHIPPLQHEEIWYLERRVEGSDVVYSFEKRESGLALLKFAIMLGDDGYKVGIAATRFATGANLPQFYITHLPVGQELCICEEAVIIGHDLVDPKLDIAI